MNAPRYIVPSMPRLRIPVFSTITSPIPAHTSGVAIVSMAPISASRLMLMPHLPQRKAYAGDVARATGSDSGAGSSPTAPSASAMH